MTFINKTILPFIILFSLCACGGSSSSSDDDPAELPPVDWQPKSTTVWEVGDAMQEGFTVEQLDAAYSTADQTNVLKNLLIVRNNKLISEAYFDGTNVDSLLHERSVTKTVIAMLIGIAIDEGYLSGINQPIGSFFEEDFPNLAANKRDITIQQLLTMTSGFEWDESQSGGYTSWANSSDPQAYLFNRDLQNTPGTEFTYNSAGAHLLSVILTKATGMSTLQYASEKLFLPLGITQLRWETLADGFYNGGAGLEMRPVDLAKIGLTLLNDGEWQSESIIPGSWVQALKAYQLNLSPGSGDFSVNGYGYLTWLGTGGNQDIKLAWGWGGQFVAMIPGKNMVVIMNSNWQVSASTAGAQYEIAFDILVNQIIPAAN